MMDGTDGSQLASKCLATDNPRKVSFEFFPPKTEAGIHNLVERIGRFKHQAPIFMDVTWGAGGTTSELTLDLCIQMKRDLGVAANMHLTCTNMHLDTVDTALQGAKEAGVRNIVALRGDPPVGQERWEASSETFTCALDLVKYIHGSYPGEFCVSVSGYPEGHPTVIKEVADGQVLSATEELRVITMDGKRYVCNDEDFDKELDYLKQKVDAGASFIITQMVFDAQVYKAFVDACKAKDITVPILPGIMCIQNFSGFDRMTRFCRSRYPQSVYEELYAVKDDTTLARQVGIRFGTQLCKDLLACGAPSLHFYTLNREEVTMGILENLGWKI
eukprot:m.23206 g.23206  ORF g.23206 m.23206 type:complete len:331 (+) comp8462_c0_seq2:74-1066(+)